MNKTQGIIVAIAILVVSVLLHFYFLGQISQVSGFDYDVFTVTPLIVPMIVGFVVFIIMLIQKQEEAKQK